MQKKTSLPDQMLLLTCRFVCAEILLQKRADLIIYLEKKTNKVNNYKDINSAGD